MCSTCGSSVPTALLATFPLHFQCWEQHHRVKSVDSAVSWEDLQDCCALFGHKDVVAQRSKIPKLWGSPGNGQEARGDADPFLLLATQLHSHSGLCGNDGNVLEAWVAISPSQLGPGWASRKSNGPYSENTWEQEPKPSF